MHPPCCLIMLCLSLAEHRCAPQEVACFLPVLKGRINPTMKSVFGLALLWSSISLSRSQCVLEKEYFCSSIPKDFPEGLTSLLFVVTNIGVINATVFSSPNLNSVTSLALANSGITGIKPGAFRAFKSLTKLSLYQNSLTEVTGAWLLHPGRLENLTVAQNLLTEITPNTLVGFSNLSTLNLANNRIRRIADESFKDLAQMTSLDLSGNNLTALTRKVFSGLMAPMVKLGGNPWNCSCDLRDFGLYLQELKNASRLEDAESVLCRRPPSLEGVPVWNISGLNCSSDLPSSAFENGFRYAGLPALLACVAFISFAFLVIWMWKRKQGKQVQPSKEATGLTTDVQPHGHSVSTTDNEKVQATRMDAGLQNRIPKAKSAMAILLRTEFPHGQQESTSFPDANPERMISPSVAINDQSFIDSEDFCSFMKLCYYHKLKDFRGKEIPSSFSETKLPSEGEKQIYEDNENPGSPKEEEEGDEDKGYDNVENPEPFLYLSISTAAEEEIKKDPQKDAIKKPQIFEAKVSLRRSLTWPYEPNLSGHKSNALSVGESFVTQCTPAPGKFVGAGKLECQEKCIEKHRGFIDDGPPEDSDSAPEVKLDRTTELLHRGAGESVDTGKSEFGDGLRGPHEIRECPQNYDLVHNGHAKLDIEEAVTKQPFREESEARDAHAWLSTPKAPKHSVVLKKKPSLEPGSSRSRARHAIQSHQPPSDHTSPTGSQREDPLVENSEYNYVNLLYEVVENRGRWTRERWRQTHRSSALHDRPAKFK